MASPPYQRRRTFGRRTGADVPADTPACYSSHRNATVIPARSSALAWSVHPLSIPTTRVGLAGSAYATATNFLSLGSSEPRAPHCGYSAKSVASGPFCVNVTRVQIASSKRMSWTQRMNASPTPGRPARLRFCRYSEKIKSPSSRDSRPPSIISRSATTQANSQLGSAEPAPLAIIPTPVSTTHLSSADRTTLTA